MSKGSLSLGVPELAQPIKSEGPETIDAAVRPVSRWGIASGVRLADKFTSFPAARGRLRLAPGSTGKHGRDECQIS